MSPDLKVKAKMKRLRFSVPLLLLGSLCQVYAGAITTTFTPMPSGSNIDLTALGQLDWVHWGVNIDGSPDRKANVTPEISDFTLLGSQALGPFPYSDSSNSYTWYDGIPNRAVTNTSTGDYVIGGASVGSGFLLTAPADTSQKTLEFFVGATWAQGRLTASLSDGGTSFTSQYPQTVDNAAYGPNGLFTIAYAASSPGQTLTVTWTVAQAHDRALALVTLDAAVLAVPEPRVATLLILGVSFWSIYRKIQGRASKSFSGWWTPSCGVTCACAGVRLRKATPPDQR
jgi:hypothetical protein